MRDVDEITSIILKINSVVDRLGARVVVVIPPVFETSDPRRMNSNVNKVIDAAIKGIRAKSKDVLFIDDRRSTRYLGEKNSDYYYHYDHPSPRYGVELYRRLSQLL